MDLSSTNALIIVDMQNDYCSDGSVPVAGAAALVKTLSDLSRRVMSRGGRVLATQDWHTDKHLSFSENGRDLAAALCAGHEGGRTPL
jgi:nicotinamidase/pyrazinamidase